MWKGMLVMKIRSGFVSNSSSSSFVILGVKYEATLDDDWSDVWNWKSGDLRTVCDDGVYYRGLVLGESDCDFMEYGEYSRTEISNAAQAIAEELGVTMDDVKIYVGTRRC
jgi:hypothetical protein